MKSRQIFIVFTILAVLSLLLQGGEIQKAQASSPIFREGIFIIIWGDGIQGSRDSQISYYLSTAQNGYIQLIISDDLLTSNDGPTAVNRKAVRVQGIWQDIGESMLVQDLTLTEGEANGPEGIYGPQPWVSIMCKFSDVPVEPNDLGFFKNMYSAQYPGLDHYWQQQSYDLASLEGSGAFGWYVLPHPRSYYLPGGNFNLWTAASDCTAVANAAVDFKKYEGINLMFNDLLDCCAWGGGWYACLDGLCQTWRTTWEPPWGYQNIGVIAHETGHGFGLPHSLGNCQQGYDNRWDVLSDVWNNGTDPNFPQYGTMGQHTISYHKEMLEWFTPEQIHTSQTGTFNTITLERLALPVTDNYREARILINNNPNYFYTLEVRQPTDNPIDYDRWLPGFALIIHEVATGRQEPAIVIDRDTDCDTGDAGAMFVAGEVFTDIPNGISVSIDSATDTGYVVSINNRFTIIQDVGISGGADGSAGVNIPFTATVSPSEATIPITYTWEATEQPTVVHMADTVDEIDFTWDDIGTKTITVTASNAGGSVTDTHSIEIGSMIPIVTLSGPKISRAGEANVFTAIVVPPDIAQPITYTWQASEQIPITKTGGLSDSVSFTWDEPGTQVITVTASNILGSTADHYTLPIIMPPSDIEISGNKVGSLYGTSTFTATVTPVNTSVPLTYTWTVDNQSPIIHTNGVLDLLTLTWEKPGLHQLSVSATNIVGIVVGSWEIEVYVKIFIPIGLRN